MSSHWRPDPDAPDPEMPGQKLQMASYIPARPSDLCRCGSGKAYRDCCRLQRYWYPICPNPGLDGYSLRSPQSATFENVDGQVLRMRLMEDVRLRCTEDTPDRGFWLYWGDPALDDQYGTLCFGDIELKHNRTLLVTSLSDVRMRTLLDLLREIAADLVAAPKMHYASAIVADKRTGNNVQVPPLTRTPRPRRRRR
jgi:hypothetical protein